MSGKVMTGDDIVMISTDDLEPNPWNPQKMSDAQFNELVEEIRDDGFDEPLLVVEHPEPDKAKDGKFMIVAGEHRWQAMRVLGHDKIPCIIKTEWDERDQKIKTVRRNVLRGETDKPKFSALVHSLNEDNGIPIKELPGLMGFKDEAAFRDRYIAEKRQEEEDIRKAASSRAREEEKRETRVVDNLSYVLNEILSQYGDTVPQGFVFFWYKNKFHLMVQEDEKLEKAIEAMVKYLRETGKHVRPFLQRALDLAFADVKEQEGTDPRKARAISGKAGDSGDNGDV